MRRICDCFCRFICLFVDVSLCALEALCDYVLYLHLHYIYNTCLHSITQKVVYRNGAYFNIIGTGQND